MKKIFTFIIIVLIFSTTIFSQPTISPTLKHDGIIYITHATIHVGNNTIINDGTIKINKGKIERTENRDKLLGN